MKVIDLLNKISNGEELPKKIKYDDTLYEFDDKKDNYYKNEFCSINWDYVSLHCLNEEVEIIEEEKKITPTDFENLGYALGSIQKYINKGYNKAIEEKKIPEKLEIELNSGDENKVNYYRTTNLECDLAFKINEIIDYLKSKGE